MLDDTPILPKSIMKYSLSFTRFGMIMTGEWIFTVMNGPCLV